MEIKMRYVIILTPTAKSDIVNLKISLAQQLIDQSIIRKELRLIYEKISSLTIFPERYPIINSDTKYRKLSHRKYLILYKVINNLYICVLYSTFKNEYITGTTKHIKKVGSRRLFFNALLRVYVVVHRRRHLRRWYQEFVLVHAHRFDLVLMILCQRRQRS